MDIKRSVKVYFAGLLAVATFFGGLSYLFGPKAHKNDLHNNSVMIVNRAMNHGGTGVIMRSTKSESFILTNDHVCKAVSSGGIVRTETQNYQVASIMESEVSDLCLVSVLDDLKVNTSWSNKEPKPYEKDLVSGHPALMPNVISEGHYSGKSIIQVMTGLRPCTQADFEDPKTGIVCVFFNGVPVIKAYESVLVTSTIMPGSSGSGVYNESQELTGLVFAGNTEFGYAWTVPYNQLVNFVTKEHKTLKKQYMSQEVSLFGGPEDSKHIKEVLQKCQTAQVDETINEYCEILKKDMTWMK